LLLPQNIAGRPEAKRRSTACIAATTILRVALLFAAPGSLVSSQLFAHGHLSIGDSCTPCGRARTTGASPVSAPFWVSSSAVVGALAARGRAAATAMWPALGLLIAIPIYFARLGIASGAS
jgi:hypothetical protein